MRAADSLISQKVKKILRLLLIALAAALLVIAGLLIWLRVSPPAPAALPFSDEPIGLKLIAENLTAPVALESPQDETGRLFVADQTGLIDLIDQDLGPAKQPFLDLRDRIVPLSALYDERGLLGLAFHPHFRENGRFFVYYSAPLRAGAPANWNHTGRLSEFRIIASNPDQADPGSERILLEIDEPQMNHNGGQLAFGPDGFLYIGLGDGGAANDTGQGHSPQGNAQDLNSLLGKILRIDVDSGDPYAIPHDNPFVGTEGRDEIYAYGLRNPYRFSFDAKGTNALFAADVGQNRWEEVNIITKQGNYGWNIREGNHCLQETESCAHMGSMGESLIDPILEYSHDAGLSVIGGYVYRGSAMPHLQGSYIFGDWGLRGLQAHGRIFVARQSPAAGRWSLQEVKIAQNALEGLHILAFGQDTRHELYVLTKALGGPGGTTGKIFKLVPAR